MQNESDTLRSELLDLKRNRLFLSYIGEVREKMGQNGEIWTVDDQMLQQIAQSII